MGGLPFLPLPGLPGFGPSLPKLGGDQGSKESSPDFGALFDQLKQGGQASPAPMLTPPAPSLSVPSVELPGVSASAPMVSGVGQLGQPLHEFLDSVNRLQLQSDHMKQELATGGDVELHDVMIAAEKASLSVDLTMQIRNKLLDAYQEIMRMSV